MLDPVEGRYLNLEILLGFVLLAGWVIGCSRLGSELGDQFVLPATKDDESQGGIFMGILGSWMPKNLGASLLKLSHFVAKQIAVFCSVLF